MTARKHILSMYYMHIGRDQIRGHQIGKFVKFTMKAFGFLR